MFKSNVIRSGLLALGMALLSACGANVRPGAIGGFFNAPDNQAQPSVGNPVEPYKVILFATQEIYTGDFTQYASEGVGTKARDGADTLCRQYSIWPDREVRAVLGIDVDDQIKDMPAIYKFDANAQVVGDRDIVIGDRWDDLLDGSLKAVLQVAVINLAMNGFYWTGSNGEGIVDVNNNCAGFTIEDSSESAFSGLASDGDHGWMDAKNHGCQLRQQLLCIAF